MIDNVEQYFRINPNAFQFNNKLNKDIGKSVHYKNKERFILAQKQKESPIVPVSDIVKLVNNSVMQQIKKLILNIIDILVEKDRRQQALSPVQHREIVAGYTRDEFVDI